MFRIKIVHFLVISKKVPTFATRLRSLTTKRALRQRKERTIKIKQSNEKNISTFSEKEKEQTWFP